MKRVTTLLAVVALVAGCGSSEPPAPSGPPDGVSVTLGQWRSDEPAHRLQVAVRNTRGTPVYFADVQLVTPSFRTVPASRADAAIGRTGRTDLPIPYGAANCSPGGLPEVRPATVVAHLRVGSEPLREVAFDLPHPDPLLARLLRDECSEFLIQQAVSIAFGHEWTESGKIMRGALIVTRRGAGAVRLAAMGGTTHYNVAYDGRSPGLLPAAEERLEIPVELTPARCDGHAFGEAKKAFQFPVRASIDGGEERVIVVAPPKPLQDRLIGYASRACGFGR
ncbi:hypothetical protein E1267_38540 [Nonomuraea longispora]|uniref:Lipoprotein n=1 Tax=Nonomuraea longispora TaxID=1848320 RepID=A0A4R4MR84_9ACTN|nr:hypothetical protein [Nonomuraea longispora]TDB98594.1 hypothetical protein E1267_38540 [Nonomuraea longispora]